MDFLTRLQNLEKTINENKILKAKLEQKRDQLEEEYKKLIADLEAEGIKESDLSQAITNLEIEIEEEIAAAEEQLK
jgi:hypothetical protein